MCVRLDITSGFIVDEFLLHVFVVFGISVPTSSGFVLNNSFVLSQNAGFFYFCVYCDGPLLKSQAQAA